MTAPRLLAQTPSGDHWLTRLHAPELAARARPGHRLALDEGEAPLLRRDAAAGWIELLTPFRPGRLPNAPELTGTPFPEPGPEPALVIGEESGIAAALFLALELARRAIPTRVILGSSTPFPFRPHPSRLLMPEMPPEAIATLPLLEEHGIPCRLAHPDGLPGCFEGDALALAFHAQRKLPKAQYPRALYISSEESSGKQIEREKLWSLFETPRIEVRKTPSPTITA